MPFVLVSGLTWLAVWFISNGWQNWCTDRFVERLRADEEFFVQAFTARLVRIGTKSGD